MIKIAYEMGAELARHSFEHEPMEKVAILGLFRGLGAGARWARAAEATSRAAPEMSRRMIWQNKNSFTRATKPLTFLLGFANKPGLASKRMAHWVGMPLGFGLMSAGFAGPDESKTKAFLKGVAGGLAFNVAMPIGAAIGGGATKLMLRAPIAKANTNLAKTQISEGALKATPLFAKTRNAQGIKEMAIPYKELSGGPKALRFAVGAGGLAGSIGLGLVGSHAVEDALDQPLQNIGFRDSGPFNPAALRR